MEIKNFKEDFISFETAKLLKQKGFDKLKKQKKWK